MLSRIFGINQIDSKDHDINDDGTIEDEFNKQLRDKIHNNLMRRRFSSESEYFSIDDQTSMLSGRPSSSGNMSTKSMISERNERINKYLEDQNTKFNKLIEKNLNYVSHTNLKDIYKFDNLNDEKIDEFLSKIDNESKYKIYSKLEKEYKTNNFENLTVLSKIEILIILIIKIDFLILKYSLPISKVFYRKFISNQMILVNNNNFNKLLTIMINFINNFENFDFKEDEKFEDINDNNEKKWVKPSIWNIVQNYYSLNSVLNAAEEFVNQIQ
ncbi:hypothetical protein CLIB1444_02S06788 [[Candida] jaroonii]|uniref:Uncharacterized protein n=1 Tax=[Candida] jaroonii TaxID=467808 RepID=A0ACA9Y323_9ASCO|nr:hypothetical protein CLIB1444_02S06788 [[Candida] jaroonii]